eukprot:403346287
MEQAQNALSHVYMVSGDLGGTNTRLYLLKLNIKHTQDEETKQLDLESYETLAYKHVPTPKTKQPYEEINALVEENLEKISDRSLLKLCVISIAGPVFDGICLITCDIPHWQTVKESDLQELCQIPTVRLVNDYTANGYGIIDLANDDQVSLYKPEQDILPSEDVCKIVYGIGTGLGVCMMGRPNETVPFHHYPSEGGIAPLALYNSMDRKFIEFLNTQKGKANPVVISVILGGCGLPYLVEFLATVSEENREKYKDCPILTIPFADIQPEQVTEYARDKQDQLCIDSCYYFLDFSAKYLSDYAAIYLPLGGLYITASVFKPWILCSKRKKLDNILLTQFITKGH